ncbi:MULTISPECIES: ABC transporter substrate-binding protein [Rhizobium]|uniref:Peptide/nickel transport system substrate-binding protein n=1 Tax=Rhizobium binae TaxID=1138190 RepID=A0ABV2ML62_9HYPH|nr:MULTISPECIES: ABC transporter substrate-binding protein [Rhizobium]NKL49633.1 twin-arginine translocation signal domain-containing protein [Rhizobium leguminosarum bv. viciae]MBX4937024.1 twin-arginine translocation signal domain-containing protein [Rhizobium binae]MBX4943674.1 twin-arginine translocation signal domain-containing protein [Rhizobium binae]MBX4979118.1 twin-arginine translocation signal domain-containing protein [Rhizobium binae]MBX4995855.1 twin-arginine translocation signal
MNNFYDLNRRSFLKATAAVSGGIVAAGMPLSQAIWAAEGKRLTCRLDYDLDTLDPAFYYGSYNCEVMSCIYSKLIRFKPGSTWEWELEAAEKIEQVDPTHIRFQLKKGIEFSDGGGELTAGDVKFSFERAVKIGSFKMDCGPLDRVELENDYTGVIVYKTPFVPAWNISLPYGVGHILSEAAVKKAGKEASSIGMSKIAYSGPYVLAEWQQNRHAILTPNPAWSGPKPGFDEIRIIPILDIKAAERAYQAGDVDFTNISVDSLANFKENTPADTQVDVKPSIDFTYIGMNMDHPKLKDINVRKAIQWAINVPQIIDAAYAGQVDVATGIVAKGLVGHRNQAVVPPEGDLEKAKEFLEQAGVQDLTLTIDCQSLSTHTTIAQVVQAQLSQIGITVDVNVQDAGSFYTLGAESAGDRWKELQLFVQFFTMLPDPYNFSSYYTTDQIGNWDWERFGDKRFDELHARAVTLDNAEERSKLYSEMQDIMENSGAYRFLTNDMNTSVFRKTKIRSATRPDGHPLYLEFKPVSA